MPSAQPFRRLWALSIQLWPWNHKFIQCLLQPALLGCVTEMCPCGCVTVESHFSAGERTWGLPSLITVTGSLKQSPSWVQRGLFCALGHLPCSSQHSQYRTVFSAGSQNQTQHVFPATPPLLWPSLLTLTTHLHTYCAPWRPAHWIGQSTWTH